MKEEHWQVTCSTQMKQLKKIIKHMHWTRMHNLKKVLWKRKALKHVIGMLKIKSNIKLHALHTVHLKMWWKWNMSAAGSLILNMTVLNCKNLKTAVVLGSKTSELLGPYIMLNVSSRVWDPAGPGSLSPLTWTPDFDYIKVYIQI